MLSARRTNLLELELPGKFSDGVEHIGPLLLELFLDVLDFAVGRLVLAPKLLELFRFYLHLSHIIRVGGTCTLATPHALRC